MYFQWNIRLLTRQVLVDSCWGPAEVSYEFFGRCLDRLSVVRSVVYKEINQSPFVKLLPAKKSRSQSNLATTRPLKFFGRQSLRGDLLSSMALLTVKVKFPCSRLVTIGWQTWCVETDRLTWPVASVCGLSQLYTHLLVKLLISLRFPNNLCYSHAYYRNSFKHLLFRVKIQPAIHQQLISIYFAFSPHHRQ